MIASAQLAARSRRKFAARSGGASREGGFAYLLAMMLVMALMIASLAALQAGLAQAKRKQEALAIWRGEQYVRAIRSFYKKTNRYPRSIEELQKGVNDIHFLRPSAYKNPMNPSDGAWRMIYVNPAGQLIGSTRYANLQQMALIVLNNGQMPKNVNGVPGLNSPSLFGGQPSLSTNGANNPNGQSGANGGANGQNGANGANGTNGQNPGGGTAGNGGAASGDENGDQTQQPDEGEQPVDNSGQNPSPPQTNATTPNPGSPPQAGAPGANQPGQGFLGSSSLSSGTDQTVNPLLTMKPTGPVSGPVVGGFLTGVALIQEVKSQKVYQGGKKYIEWEFIWNPMIDQARALASGQGQGATGALGAPNGLNGNGLNGANGQNGQNGNNGFGFGGILGGQQPNQQPQQQQPNQQPQQPQQQDPNQPQQ